MIDALLQGLLLVLQWNAFSLMLPFVFKMSPVKAFAFLLGMHSVAATTGDINSILFGVPW